MTSIGIEIKICTGKAATLYSKYLSRQVPEVPLLLVKG